MPDPTEGNGGGTTVKTIRLNVVSPKLASLDGIATTLQSLREISMELVAANTLAGRLQRTLAASGFVNISKGASRAAGEISRVAASAGDLKRAMSEVQQLSKGWTSQSRMFSNWDLAKAGDYLNQRREMIQTGRKIVETSNLKEGVTSVQVTDKPGDFYAEANKLAKQYEAVQSRRTRDISTQAERDDRAQELRKARADSQRLAAEAKSAKTLDDQREKLWAWQSKQEEIRRMRNRDTTEKEVGGYEAGRLKRAEAIHRSQAESVERVSAERAEARRQRIQKDADRKYLERRDAYQSELLDLERKHRVAQKSIPKAKSSSRLLGVNQDHIALDQKLISDIEGVNKRYHMAAKERVAAENAMWKARARIAGRDADLGGGARGGGGIWGGHGRWLERGMAGWTPTGMLRNALTAGGWMTAVGGFFAVTRTISYSVKRMAELELQTARLQQVFRGVGGTANELTDDVIKLAAAEGRGTQEAMQSAIAWSRLGLSRRQAAEATRVSLMAANVAEMTADEATQHLAATMAAYNLQVSELESALGMLNQTSNTYRVTNKDLLTGISRVSGVAQQAGLSLAELQGIIAASVQQTGQTGPNIANALKTVLVRMNRKDVKEFLGERFNMASTGSAEDLKKIWAIYSKANSETQRDIQLKIGAATQASRFRSIMESYPEAMRAAIMSMRNLSSAEKENLLVTNTLIAAKNRFVSSWDRVSNQPTVLGRPMAGALNIGSGVMNAVANTFGTMPNQKTRYFNPDKANLLGVAGALFGFGGMRQLLSLTPSLNKGYTENMMRNLGYSDKPTTATDKFQSAMQDIYNDKYASAAEEKRADWMKTLSANWGDLRPEKRGEVLKSLKDIMSESSIARLGSATDEEARGIFSEESARAQAEHLRLRQSAIEKINAKAEDIKKNEKDDANRQSRLNELYDKRNGLLEETVDESIDWEQHQERIVPFIERAKALLSDIKELTGSLGLTKAASEILTLQQQIGALKEMVHTPGVDDSVKVKFNEERSEMEAKLAYLQSMQGKLYSKSAERRDIVSAMSQTQIKTSGVGVTEGERLLSQRDWIEAQLGRYEGAGSSMGEDDYVRALALQNALKNTELEISKRLLENDQERKQLLLETNKEFQKTLATAGPGDILRKIATKALMGKDGGMNAGAFFAMSPEARGDIMQMMGGSRMAELNAERRALQGNALGVGGLKRAWEQAGDRSTELAQGYTRASSLPAQNAWQEYQKALNSGDRVETEAAWKKYQAERSGQPTQITSGTKPSRAWEDTNSEEASWRRNWGDLRKKFGGGSFYDQSMLDEAGKEVDTALEGIRKRRDALVSSGRDREPIYATYNPSNTATSVAADAAAKSVTTLGVNAAACGNAIVDMTRLMINLTSVLSGVRVPDMANSQAPSARTPAQGTALRRT
jgi:TP901 family phage tail tape measure protein